LYLALSDDTPDNGSNVEILWTPRANPVEKPTEKKNLHTDPVKTWRRADVDGAFAIRFA